MPAQHLPKYKKEYARGFAEGYEKAKEENPHLQDAWADDPVVGRVMLMIHALKTEGVPADQAVRTAGLVFTKAGAAKTESE